VDGFMTKRGKDGRKGTMDGSSGETISHIKSRMQNWSGTVGNPNSGMPYGWNGIGPIAPENHRTASAALDLLRAFDDGTAISR
jgi:hypothetical protein